MNIRLVTQMSVWQRPPLHYNELTLKCSFFESLLIEGCFYRLFIDQEVKTSGLNIARSEKKKKHKYLDMNKKVPVKFGLQHRRGRVLLNRYTYGYSLK